MVKNLLVRQETWVWSLGWEDPLEESMATHSSILAWIVPWTEVPGGLHSWGRKESDTTEWLNNFSLSLLKWNLSVCQTRSQWQWESHTNLSLPPPVPARGWSNNNSWCGADCTSWLQRINSFNPRPVRQARCPSSFHGWENWGSERFKHPLETTQLACGGLESLPKQSVPSLASSWKRKE